MKSGSITTTRILLVEDHEPFRKFVRTFLGQLDDFQLVGEAGDGLSAVRKCVELQPDLVLLDIGLPELNGIQVARQIRQLAPDSRIVFLTQESSSAIVHEALSLGAAAYVIKAHTASDLILAIIAAREGRQFVSSGLDGSIRLSDPPSPLGGKDTFFTPLDNRDSHHEVFFYPDDLSFAAGVSAFIERSLKAEKVVLAVIKESHRQGILKSVQENGVDTRSAINSGRLVFNDPVAFQEAFMPGGRVDPERMLQASSAMVESLMREHPGARICACGECGSDLLAQGKVEAALQIERVWDQLSVGYHLDLFCGYIFTGLQRAEDLPGYREISAWHSHASSH